MASRIIDLPDPVGPSMRNSPPVPNASMSTVWWPGNGPKAWKDTEWMRMIYLPTSSKTDCHTAFSASVRGRLPTVAANSHACSTGVADSVGLTLGRHTDTGLAGR